MNKPMYYLFKQDKDDIDKIEKEKNKLVECGFNVVMFIDGVQQNDINNALKKIITDHI